MSNEHSTTDSHPEGAAKLVAPEKVKPVDAPVEVDQSLMKRGAPGQPGGEPAKTEAAEFKVDLSKLPQDEQGNPRDLSMDEAKLVKEAVIAKLRTIYDPEIPVDVYELGLIYNVSVGLRGDVKIKMTLTSPACPVAGTLPGEVEVKIREIDRVTQAAVELVWDPQWNKDMMSEAAKLELNVM